MKTLTSASITAQLCAGLLLFAPAHAEVAPTAAPSAKPDTEAKPYVLYMRTDVAVEQDKKLYPIKDVSGKDFIVSVGGQREAVPMSGGQHRIEFKYVLTLAPATASLTGLKSERAYTPGTDPRMVRQREAAMTSAVMGDNASLREGKFISTYQGGLIGYGGRYAGSQVVRGTVGAPGGEQVFVPQPTGRTDRPPPDPWDLQADVEFSSMNLAETMLASNLGQAAASRERAESDLAKKLFDAVAISFEVSSKVFLEKPYLVVTTRFHEADAKPGMIRSGVFAKALESIGAHPTKIEVLHGGFPPGFELEEVQVHLYNEGKEIPTDVVPKRVPLTRDDAFAYLMIDYLHGHKGDTLPATPAIGRPARLELAKLTPNQVKAPYFVKVAKTGLPGGVFADEECSQPADEAVAALAGAARYYPALEQGKAVDGVARLVLTQLEL